jgi:hypothetical protein
LLKENPLKMSKFLKNRYFFNEISPRYILITENDNFLKGNDHGSLILTNDIAILSKNKRFTKENILRNPILAENV